MYRGTTLISADLKHSTLTSLKDNGSPPEHFSDHLDLPNVNSRGEFP